MGIKVRINNLIKKIYKVHEISLCYFSDSIYSRVSGGKK